MTRQQTIKNTFYSKLLYSIYLGVNSQAALIDFLKELTKSEPPESVPQLTKSNLSMKFKALSELGFIQLSQKVGRNKLYEIDYPGMVDFLIKNYLPEYHQKVSNLLQDRKSRNTDPFKTSFISNRLVGIFQFYFRSLADNKGMLRLTMDDLFRDFVAGVGLTYLIRGHQMQTGITPGSVLQAEGDRIEREGWSKGELYLYNLFQRYCYQKTAPNDQQLSAFNLFIGVGCSPAAATNPR